MPTIILSGEFDIPDVQAYCGAIAAGIPGARRGIIGGAGHLVQLDSPQEVTKRLIRLWSEIKLLRSWFPWHTRNLCRPV